MKLGKYYLEVDKNGDLWIRPTGYGDYHGANPIIWVSHHYGEVSIWSDRRDESSTHDIDIDGAKLR